MLHADFAVLLSYCGHDSPNVSKTGGEGGGGDVGEIFRTQSSEHTFIVDGFGESKMRDGKDEAREERQSTEYVSEAHLCGPVKKGVSVIMVKMCANRVQCPRCGA